MNMTKTEKGDVVIHKETWDILSGDSAYAGLTKEIEYLEAHYDSLKDDGTVSWSDYKSKRASRI